MLDPTRASHEHATSSTEQAGDSLTATTISSAGSTPTVVRIEVTGRSLSVLPGVPGIEVTATAVGPVERFTTDGAP